MSSADFDLISWSTKSAADLYANFHNAENSSNAVISGTNNLIHVIENPMLVTEAERYIAKRLESMKEGEVEAIALWKPNAFKKHTINVAVMIPGEEIPATGRFETIEKFIVEKACLKEGERATNIKIISETPKYVSTVLPVAEKKTMYYIIGGGVSANDVLRGVVQGYGTRMEARTALKKILSRSRSTKINLTVSEDFEIIGITRVSTAKAQLSKLAVRAKLDIVTVDPSRPRDGWIFYGRATA